MTDPNNETACFLFPTEEKAVVFAHAVNALEFEHLLVVRYSTVAEITGLQYYFAELAHDLATMAKTIGGDPIPASWRTTMN